MQYPKNLLSLSICIPTFQRVADVFSLVSDLLQCQRTDFEIVVIDNQSLDDTLQRLNSIADTRLIILQNDTNIGGWLNVVQSVSYGSGRVKLFMTDKDSCHYQMLDAFIEFLNSNPAVGCGYCLFSDEPERRTRIFSRGFRSTQAVGYTWRHPTGYFFNAQLLAQIQYASLYTDSQQIGQFPFDLLLAELSTMSFAAIYTNGLFTRESATSAAKIKSHITNGNSGDAFFTPENRLKVALNFARHLENIALSTFHKRQVEARVFLSGLTSSTNGLRILLSNEQLCRHYHIESRTVKSKELFRIAFAYSINFFIQRDASNASRFIRMVCIVVFGFPELVKKTLGRF